MEEKFDGADAVAKLAAVYEQLTPEQRKIAAPYLRLAPFPASKLQLPPFNLKPFAPPPAFRKLLRRGAYMPPAVEAGFFNVLDLPQTEEQKYEAYFRPIFQAANQAIAGLTGQSPLKDNFEITFFNDPVDAYALTTDFLTLCVDVTANDPVNCRVADANKPGAVTDGKHVDAGRRLPQCWTALNVAHFNLLDEQALISLVTHEVFHCYQHHAVGSLAETSLVPAWLTEGEATWVEATLLSTTYRALQLAWRDYVSTPKGHLYDRSYNAIGFYGHLADVRSAGAVASNLIPAYQAGKGSSGAAYGLLAGSSEDAMLDSWGSSYFLGHPGKELWTMKGPAPGNIPGSGPEVTTVSVGPGDAEFLPKAGAWETTQSRIRSSAEIVEFTLDSGHSSILDTMEERTLHPGVGETLRFCMLEEGCQCPEDTDGTVPPTQPGHPPFDVGLTGGRVGASAHVRGHTLEEYCKEREPLKPPAGAVVGGSGSDEPGSVGRDPPPPGEPVHGKASSDPHIATIDGRWYDIQALGEFVLSQSTVDDFLVQVRFATADGARNWSTAVAMATHAGIDRIVVSINLAAAEPVPTLKINGQTSDSDLVLLEGATVRRVETQWGPGFVVSFADGTRVGANLTARTGLSAWVNPAPGRRGKLRGLLGDADGEIGNDPVVRGGALLSSEPTYDELYEVFVPSWRIEPAESLFDYRTGESTATYTDATFPGRNAATLPKPALESAAEFCAARGVTDKDLMRNCSFDLVASGEKSYLAGYQSQQYRVSLERLRIDIEAKNSGLAGNGVASTPEKGLGVARSLVIEGRVSASSEQPTTRFAGSKGDILYVDPRNCIDLHFPLLSKPDGRELASSNMCGARLVLPADGQYSFQVNRFADHDGEYRYPIVAVRADRILGAELGMTLKGNVEQRAEHDVYRIEVAGKTPISMGGTDCKGDFDVELRYGDETVTAGSLCRFSYELPKAGTYQLVLNSSNSATGPYAFVIRQAP
ncbi:MAG: VWD domain-containing protein [Gammaproteobacteria bacterium]